MEHARQRATGGIGLGCRRLVRDARGALRPTGILANIYILARNPCRDPDRNTPRRHGADHDCVGADYRTLSDHNITQDLGASSDEYVIFDPRDLRLLISSAYRDALGNKNILADFHARMDNDTYPPISDLEPVPDFDGIGNITVKHQHIQYFDEPRE